MSEADPMPPPPEPAEPAKSPDDSGPPASKPARRHKWLRRFRLTMFALLLLFCLFRIALQFALPAVIRRTAAIYGLSARYERHEIDLVGGDVGLWHLVIRPAEGGDPIVTADYCRGDVSTLDLLMGRLLVRRLEAEGIDVNLERTADGDVPLITKMAQRLQQKNAAPQQVKPAATAKPAEIDLTSPFQMDAFRVDRVRAHLRDRSVTPALDVNAELSMRLTDLRSPVRPSTLDLDLTARPVLESLRVNAKGHAGGKILDGWTEVTVSGFHPRTIAPYLKALGVRPDARDLSGTCSFKVKTAASTRPACLAAAAELYDVEVYADGHEALALDSMSLDAASVGAREADVTRLSIDGVRCNAERSPAGTLRVAGFEWVPPSTAAPTTAVATSQPTVPPDAAPFAWALHELKLSRVNAAFVDRAVTPAATLGIALDAFDLRHLSNDPLASTRPIDVSMSLQTPGIARGVRIAGQATPFASKRSAQFTLTVEGLKPDALAPYLDAAGIGCSMTDANLTCAVEGTLRPGDGHTQIADARLTGVKLTDGRDLLVLSQVTLGGLVLGGPADRLTIDSVDVTGPALEARRRADGQFESIGLFTKPSAAKPRTTLAVADASDGPAAPATARATAALPRVEIGHFRWGGLRIRYEDQGVTPAAAVTTDDGGIDVENLCLDLRPGATGSDQPAKVKAWVKAPGLAGDLQLNGTLTSTPTRTVLDADLTGAALTAAPAAGYLKALGVEPVLTHGDLRLRTRLALNRTPQGLTGDVALTDVSLTDTGQELAALDALKVTGFTLQPGKTQLGNVVADRPRFHLTREKDGTFTAAGFHTLLQPPPPAPPATTRPATAPAVARPDVLALQSLRLTGATFRWTDKAAPTPVDVTANVSAAVDALVIGGPPQEARVDFSASLAGVAANLEFTGRIVPDASAPSLRGQINAAGVKAGALATYLPPGLKSELADGRFRATVDARLAPEAKGRGAQLALAVTDLDFRDGPAATALLSFDAATLKVSRFDPQGQAIAIDEMSLSGLNAQARKAADGMHALGFALVDAPPAASATRPAAAIPAAATAPAANPDFAAAPAQPTTTPAASDIAHAVAAQRQKLPLITVRKLDLAASRITFTDEGSAPIVVTDLSLKNRQPIEMLGPDAENRPPLELDFNCRPAPFAQSLAIETRAAPFALRPRVDVTMNATGIKGDDLLAAYPQLKPSIDASALGDGRFAAQLSAELKVDRHDLLHLDFSRPFDATVGLKDVTFRNGDGPVLAGVGEVRSEAIHVDPKTGAVHAKSLEVTNLVGSASREPDGLHALGIVLRPTTAPAAAPTTSPATPPAIAIAAPPPPAPATKPAGEIRLDRLTVSGVAFTFVDKSVTPPLEFPVTSLELEARDLSNYLLYDADRSTRFSLLVNSGKVTLPKPLKKAGLAGAFTDVGGADASKEAVGETEQRELFSQAAASGKLSLYPHPQGWAKASVSGLELAALRGEARQAGFGLAGGTFDADVDARFRGDGSLDLRPRLVLVDLAMSEPPQGPVSRYLNLPAPLDAVIKILQDASGRITVSLHVPVKSGGDIGTGAVAASAVGAFGGIVTKALASAPVKGIESAASLIGVRDLFGFHRKLLPLQPLVIPFDAAMAWAPPVDDFALPEEWAKRLRKEPNLRLVLKHDLSAADLELVATRANPAADDVTALAFQLRQHKDELLKQRAALAGRARGELGSGVDAPQTLTRLRDLNREIAANEDALDELYDLLRPGANRQNNRRTRAACLALGRARLESTRAAIQRANPTLPNLATRITVMPPQFTADDAATTGRVTLSAGGGKPTATPAQATAIAGP